MTTKKSTSENWSAARMRWETEPPCTFSDLVDFLGVSKQAIAKRARKEGWAKQLDMARITAMAHQKADRDSTAANAEKLHALPEQGPVVVYPENSPGRPDLPPESRHEAETSAAVAARAAVLERHRTEWTAARNFLYAAIKSKDPDTIKAAKAAAEAMKKIQEGERAAWDLDAGENGKAPIQIIIERNPGMRTVR